jgi:hypothetical protein
MSIFLILVMVFVCVDNAFVEIVGVFTLSIKFKKRNLTNNLHMQQTFNHGNSWKKPLIKNPFQI